MHGPHAAHAWSPSKEHAPTLKRLPSLLPSASLWVLYQRRMYEATYELVTVTR